MMEFPGTYITIKLFCSVYAEHFRDEWLEVVSRSAKEVFQSFYGQSFGEFPLDDDYRAFVRVKKVEYLNNKYKKDVLVSVQYQSDDIERAFAACLALKAGLDNSPLSVYKELIQRETGVYL